jgi:hypothetical protein
MPEYDWQITDVGDNGEFLTWATLVYIEDGEVIGTKKFYGTSEEPPGTSGEDLARYCGQVWYECQTTTIEERLGPFGLEWQREQEERHGRAS